MKYPVLIAAHNEEQYIGRMLGRLDATTTDPIVLVNGTADATADIARQYGATVLEFEEQGKLPALQSGLRFLGERALGPVLFTDADTYPVFPSKWAPALGQHLIAGEGPAGVNGAFIYNDGPMVSATVRTARYYQRMLKAARAGSNTAACGANMGIRLGSHEALDAVLDLPHIWGGEDLAITQQILDRQGRYTATLDPRAVVMTSARSHIPLWQRLVGGNQKGLEAVAESYVNRAAPTAVASYLNGVLQPLQPLETVAEV